MIKRGVRVLGHGETDDGLRVKDRATVQRQRLDRMSPSIDMQAVKGKGEEAMMEWRSCQQFHKYAGNHVVSGDEDCPNVVD